MEIVSLMFLSLLSIGFACYLAQRMFKDRVILALIYIFVGLKILIIVGNRIWDFLPIKPDSLYYFDQSLLVIHAESLSKVVDIVHSYGGKSGIGVGAYVLVSALFLSIFGAYVHVMPMINNLLYAIAAIILVRCLSNYLMDLRQLKSNSRLAIFSLMAYPAAFSNSLYNLRDMLNVFFFVLFMSILLMKKNDAFKNPLFYLGITGAILFRPVMIAMVAVILGLYIIIFSPNKRFRFLVLASVLIIISLHTFSFYLKPIFSPETVIEASREASVTLARSYPLDFSYPSLIDVIMDLPKRLVFFLFYPFPWERNSYNYIIPVLDSIFHLGVCGLVLFGFLRIIFRRNPIKAPTKPSLIFLFISGSAIACMIILSLVEVQFGGAMRRRIPFSMFLCFSLFWVHANPEFFRYFFRTVIKGPQVGIHQKVAATR
jgi:hypothetical protein